MKDRYGPWALVVGASDGIGEAFATQLASAGLNVALVARRLGQLEEVARRLPVETRVIAVDATDTEAVLRGVADLDVGLLVCNAALAPVGPFLELTAAEVDGVVDLNCRTAARLAHAIGPRLVRRGRGGIVLLSSMAAMQGAALVAHYAASKAYLRTLAEGLWVELRPLGVDVLACCPGLVRTPTFLNSAPKPPGRLVPPAAEPADVARVALAALGRRPVVIPGWRNRLGAFVAQHLLARRSAVVLASAQTRAMYPKEWSRLARAAEPDA
jgi:short-subunit dehydrogenase